MVQDFFHQQYHLHMSLQTGDSDAEVSDANDGGSPPKRPQETGETVARPEREVFFLGGECEK